MPPCPLPSGIARRSRKRVRHSLNRPRGALGGVRDALGGSLGGLGRETLGQTLDVFERGGEEPGRRNQSDECVKRRAGIQNLRPSQTLKKITQRTAQLQPISVGVHGDSAERNAGVDWGLFVDPASDDNVRGTALSPCVLVPALLPVACATAAAWPAGPAGLVVGAAGWGGGNVDAVADAPA